MERTGTIRRCLAAAVAAMLVAACGGGAATGDKAGGDAAPVTLRIGTDDVPGRPAADQIDQFAEQVDKVSEGQLRIEPVWQAAGEGADDWDQAVARMVVGGDLDMGMIPARAWDTEGVTSLRALHAPFLVTSDELAAQIVTGDLAAELLGGLDTVGVTGLALLPEGMRHLFVFGDPPDSLTDFEGKVIRAPTSETTYALFEALGATPDDLANDPDAFREGIESGSVVAAESSFALAGTLGAPTTAIGNIAFFPKVNSLVINTEALRRLTDAQQAILRDAARHTVDWAIEQTQSDVDAAQVYCANGGRIVANDADSEALRQAAEPVYDQLESDEATRALIEQIRTLSQDVDPAQAAVETCEPGATGGATGAETVEGAFPEGVYRMEMTPEFLIDAGVDESSAHNNAGIWTLTFEDGEFRTGEGCVGTYSVKVGRVIIELVEGPQCGSAAGKVFSARWMLDGDQLQFSDVQSDTGRDLLFQTLFGGKPFTKIG